MCLQHKALGYCAAMVAFGLTLSAEEHAPGDLLHNASLAEDTGFDFVSISDHYHPWLDAQGHSPFVWSVLGALSARVGCEVVVGVTCPTMRIHPAVLAQAVATTALLHEGRFVWGVGSGEALNEHILAQRWPPAPRRLEMLGEAIELIRELWTGESVTWRGEFYEVENARIYDPPDPLPPIVVSAFGEQAARLAADHGDGLWTSSEPDTIETWRSAGGTGPVYAQLRVCWAPTAEEALDTVERYWPVAGVEGQLSQDLPTPLHFEQASAMVSREKLAELVPCGPDPEPVIERAKQMLDAGVDHLYFHQVGTNQQGFCRFWHDELEAALAGPNRR